MYKNSSDSEDRKPIDHSEEVDAAKTKQENINTENLIKAIRSDMHLISDTSPEKKNIFQRLNLKLIFGILLTLFIIVLAWFMLGGPGRPILEHNLALLVDLGGTSTPQISITELPAASPTPSKTPIPSATPRPTTTPTVRVISSPTALTATTTSTPVPSCRDVLTITLADVGQTLCVQGVVIQTIEQPNAFLVIFSDQPGSFYWVSYDMVWSKAELDTCYQTTGTIAQLGNRPILIFGYSNIPEICQ
jgi:hypothetical protein